MTTTRIRAMVSGCRIHFSVMNRKSWLCRHNFAKIMATAAAASPPRMGPTMGTQA